MKKNDLIKMLQGIDGNPDVLLWNGFVGDWQDFSRDLHRAQLHKIPFAEYKRLCIAEGSALSNEDLRRNWKIACRWRLWRLSDFTCESQKKPVVLLSTKDRGVKTFDRLGSISY